VRFIRLFPVVISLILPVVLLWGPVEAAQKKTTSTAKKTAAKKSTTQAKAGSKASTAKTAAKSAKGRKATAKSKGPQRPEPERIKEIQTALASRGYDVEPNGVWDSRSVEAVKKFQDDNEIKNLTGKGKLDSLTLIALGLGPKHGPQAEKPKTNPEGQQP
jgi:peptidoglycan hydrolase-like protein with peptidoglycan-binding domain